MEYWDPAIVIDMTIGIGEPHCIDDRTLRKEICTYARILIDVDFTRGLPEEILI